MAFSSGRFDVLREITSKDSPEEDADFDKIPKPSEKAAKKKKKKKKQGHESSGTCEPSRAEANEAVVPRSKRNLEPTAQHHSDHPEFSLETGTRVGQQESRQATDCKPSQSEIFSVTTYSSKTTGTATGQRNESKASAKKTKKKKKKGANRGILTSDLNLKPPKGNDKAKKSHKDQEGGSRRILQPESNASLPKPTEEKEKERQSHDEDGGVDKIGILQSESTISLPRPPDDERKETYYNDEETVVETSTPEKNLIDLERFTNERTLLTKEEKESQNLHQVLKLMYGVGLTALRNLFMDIHPSWSNTPGDALTMDQGAMRLKRHEAASFNKGDISEWDVSLITTVLLHSKKCKDEISKRPGFEDAIRSIKDQKNQLLSHPCTDKMSDADYHLYWSAISGHLETIGASKEEINAILKENVLENGKVYRDLFLQEVASQSAVTEEIRQHHQVVNEKLDIIISNQAASGQSDCRNQLSPRGGPNWDEWIKFCDNVRNFDYVQNNYILITDAMPPEIMECFSVFRSVPWKIVLDFDPASEEKGMYKNFSSLEGKNSLVNMITPAEIRRLTSANLSRHIDSNKTQWMFVNGRENDGDDGGPQEFDGWEDNSLKDISAFFRCCSEPDKLDKNKPLVCLLLPFKDNTVPFIDVAIRRLMENFNEFDLTFVGITPKGQSCAALPDRILKKTHIRNTDLELGLLNLGMKKLFNISSEQSYCMPTSQADLPAKLPLTEYLYLKEYLDLLYEGCEDLPNMVDVGEDDGNLEDFTEEHRKSFMSGNWISFVSLKYNHDAKREISNDIRTHIQRLLDQGLTHSTIVEISHSPGSGGSTIARRVMWDIHKSYPCAFAKLEDHKFDLEDDNVFLDNLADRISTVQEICHTTPVILLDGKHARIEAVSNKLVRILNSRGKRAVLLRCNHNLEESKAQGSTLESSDVHATFSVNVRLEQSKADLIEFETKYKDYIKECKNIKSLSSLSRVFHFPLFAMLEEFRNKLQEIIYESFDEMTNVEKEIVTVVAFIQTFAAKATPAPLLYAIFQQQIQVHKSSTSGHNLQGVTYEDISAIMTERLCNLMVPANPAKFIYLGRGFKRPNYFQEMYTLQHPVVAEMVLQKAKIALKRDTLALARDFLGFPIFDDIRFIPLMKDLFVLNGCGQGRFSVLFEELKVMHPHEAGDVFCEAAEKTRDVSIVTSAARFYAKVPPQSFTKAKELIEKAFECANAKEKQKTIYDVKGVVLLKELKSLANCEKIPSLVHLEELAKTALESFRNARTFPPYFPNPLIGEVKTWVTCIEWITKHVCNGDSNLALQFITSHNAPPFFRTCVSESLNLLNIVDEIVQSIRSLPDPGKTQRESNNVRLSLLRALKNINMAEGRNESETIQECKTLCSEKMFPSSSQMELKRLQVQYVFSYVKKIENIDKRGLEYLLQLLKDLVEVEKEGIFAKYLMRICVLITGPKQYSLDQGLAVCAIWKRNSSYDALPNFYEMMIYFLKILDGGIMEYRTKYQAALESCREKSNHNCKNTMSTHFLCNTGTGMSRLITKNTLFRGVTEYKSPNNEVAENYWKTKSRKKLMECSGRIRSRQLTGKKTHLTVELKQGNIELYVAKGAGIGSADRNFVPGSMVHFVVSFNLRGPVANGITFNPSLPLRQPSLNDG